MRASSRFARILRASEFRRQNGVVNKTIYSSQSAQFTQELVRLRKEAKLSQRALAEILGREHSFVDRIESGQRRLDFVEAYWFFKALKVPPGETALRLMDALAEQDEESSGT